LEEGESLKDTLDQLIELQKWIEEHLGDFDKFQEETNLALETEAKARADEDQRLSNAIDAEQIRAQEAEAALQLLIAQNTNLTNNEKQERQQEDARLAELIEKETERANKADKELYDALAEETERANKADDELYQTIEDLTEEDIHLKSDLWTYVDIGKITGASDTSRKKIASKNDSLKDVFNAIFGTRQDKQPTITNNASLTATNSKAYSGGEYGTAVAETTETITFTLSNTGTTNYGYRVGQTEHKGSQTFYYPIVK
jgi:hypothetical protein